MEMDPHMKQRARQLRSNMSPTETLLWKHLRSRRFAGFKFRRQHVLGPWIVDYCCCEAGLVLELDGESHEGREEEDRNRQGWLEAQRWQVMRFQNSELYNRLDEVLLEILKACRCGQEERQRRLG